MSVSPFVFRFRGSGRGGSNLVRLLIEATCRSIVYRWVASIVLSEGLL